MKTKHWIITSIVILVLIILILNPFKNNSKPGEYDAFAQCLADSGLVMYGTEWCPHCQNQKEMFGKSFKFVNYIDCDKNRETCLIKGIQGYPTWKINDESYTGTQQLETLSEITGCKFDSLSQ